MARGMEYLHTMFLAEDNEHSQPIIHRQKTPKITAQSVVFEDKKKGC